MDTELLLGLCPAPYWGAMPYAPYYGGYAYGPYGGAAAWGQEAGRRPLAMSISTGERPRPSAAASAGYNAWTGNAWSSRVGTSYNSVTGRISAGQRGGSAECLHRQLRLWPARCHLQSHHRRRSQGWLGDVGNVGTGQQQTARWGQVTGPGGQTAGAARVATTTTPTTTAMSTRTPAVAGNNTITAAGTVSRMIGRRRRSRPTQQARQWGDQRSAASAWGSGNWGGGFRGASTGESSFGEAALAREDSVAVLAVALVVAGTVAGVALAVGGRSWGGGGFGGFRGRR